MIFRMDMEKSPGPMAAATRANTLMGKSMEKGLTTGRTVRPSLDNGIQGRLVERAPTPG